MKKLFSVRLLLAFLFSGVCAGLLAAEADSKAKEKPVSPQREGQAKAGAEKKKTSVRIVALKGAYEDQPASVGFDPLMLLSGDVEKPNSFFTLCEKIDELADDDDIQQVVFDLSAPDFHMNLAQLSELARHIGKLRAAEKRAFAWLESADTTHYSAACACDTILMANLGMLDLPSLSLSTLHFRDALDLLGAKASVARVGDFKGAVEPFTLSEMSDALRAHYKKMIESMNDSLVERIATGRKLSREQVRKLQSERLFTARAAAKAGLIDHLAPYGTMRETVAKLLDADVNWVVPSKPQAKQLSFFDLMGKLLGGAQETKVDEPALAVLHLDGMIIDGESERHGLLVAGPIVKAIEELESDRNVRGVVVRINSPGGSATASEAIRRALEKLAGKKPIVISMGELAASGGYWLACLGRPIYAEPGTITGSIGVFALKLSFGSLLKKIGLRVESVTLDDSATAMSMNRTWSPPEQQKMQEFVEELYGEFLQRVATSRKMKIEAVDPIAGGRVWSGAQARKLGLVDELGGLDDALAALAKKADLKPGYDVIHRPRKKSPFENLDLFGESSDEIRFLLNPSARTWLEKMGFGFVVPLQLAHEALSGKAAQAWLLAPTQMIVR